MRKSGKHVVALALAALTLAAAPAFAGGGKEKSGKLVVGFTVQDLTNPYFTTVIQGIDDHKEAAGVEVRIHDAKLDAAKQVEGVENFITQGVDVIVICPIDPVSLENAVKNAHAAKIPVMSWSEYIKGSDVFLTMDQHKYGSFAGEIAGKWAAERFPNQADAKVMFVYIHAVKALAERGQGLIDGFKKYCPGATVVADQDGNTPEEGMRAVEATLVTHPDLNVIVAANDAVALGAYESMAAAGKKAGDVGIVGLDATPEALRKIKDNTMLIGTVDIGTYDQGELFLRYSKDLAAAGLIAAGAEPRTVYVEFKPVDKSNIGNYVK